MLSVSRLAVFYDIFYAFFVFVVLISYVCGMENKKDRWFRIKEGVDASKGHKVGGVYKVKSVVGKHTLTLYVDGGGYWFYGINDLEEVFEKDELKGWSEIEVNDWKELDLGQIKAINSLGSIKSDNFRGYLEGIYDAYGGEGEVGNLMKLIIEKFDKLK